MADITPIETRWRGYRFRSRLEARWAVFFDRLGITWEYESQGYVVDGKPYLPDFELFLPGDVKMIAEVKNSAADPFDGDHVKLCRGLADESGHQVLLLIGPPAYRLYHQFTPGQQPSDYAAVFFDSDAKIVTADIYWFLQVQVNEQTGALELPHDDRGARKSFGKLFVEAVHAARSARFEHGETPA